MSRCQGCGKEAPTKYVEFYQNIGMLVLRSMRSIKGNLCRRCAKQHFSNLTGLTLVTGWWGVISAIINPFIILNNVIRYAGCMGLPDVGDSAFPVQTGPMAGPNQPLAARPGGLNVQSAKAVPGTGLEAYRQDIIMRLRGGQTSQEIATFIAPRAGVSAAVAQAYAESLRQTS